MTKVHNILLADKSNETNSTNNTILYNNNTINKFLNEMYKAINNNKINSRIEPIFKYYKDNSTIIDDGINRILNKIKNMYYDFEKIKVKYGYYRINEILNENIKYYPKNPVFHMLKGIMLQKLGQLDDAIQSFQIAAVLSHKSDNLIYWLNLAKIDNDYFNKFFSLHMIIQKIKEDNKYFRNVLYSYVYISLECGFKSTLLQTLIDLSKHAKIYKLDINKLYIFVLICCNIYHNEDIVVILEKISDDFIIKTDMILSFIEDNIDIEKIKLYEIESKFKETTDNFMECHSNYIVWRDKNPNQNRNCLFNDINSSSKEYEINGLLKTVENAGICGHIIVEYHLIETVLAKQKDIGELGWLEFKQDYSETEYIWNDVIRPIIAMRNTFGGLILYGVNDSGEIIGINNKKDIDKLGYTDFIRRTLISKIDKNHFKTSKYHYYMDNSEWKDIDNCNWLMPKIIQIKDKYILALIVYPIIPCNPEQYYIKEVKINDKVERKYFLVRNKYAESKRKYIESTTTNNNHDSEVSYSNNESVEYFKNLKYDCEDLKLFLKKLFH